jgi:hypothetical protein
MKSLAMKWFLTWCVVAWYLLLQNDSQLGVLLHEISCYEIIPNPCNRMASKIENFVWCLYVRLKWSFPTRVVGITASHHGTQVYIFTLTKPSLGLGPFKISFVFNFGVGCGGGGDGGSLVYIPRLLFLFFFLLMFSLFFSFCRELFGKCVRWEI